MSHTSRPLGGRGGVWKASARMSDPVILDALGCATIARFGRILAVPLDDVCLVSSDHASGAKASRPQLDIALRTLRDGDTLKITRLDRPRPVGPAPD
jgi:hypothetical protein